MNKLPNLIVFSFGKKNIKSAVDNMLFFHKDLHPGTYITIGHCPKFKLGKFCDITLKS